MSNTLTNILPTILARGQLALRQNAVFPQLVTRDYNSDAQKFGNVVNIPIPSAIAARAVTPANAFASNVDFSPTIAQVSLNQWYEAPMNVSDSDLVSIDPQYVMMEATEAIKSLANNVDQYILGTHVGFFGYTGTEGTTPFNGSLTAAVTAKKILSQNLAPVDGRVAVIDPAAEANLLTNQEVLQFQMRGDTGGIIDGTIGKKLGVQWYMNQNINTYTPGTGWVTGFSVSTTTGVAGGSTLHILNATASGTIKIGDLFTLASDSKTYVVTAAATASSTVGIDINIYPALSAAASVGTTLDVVASAYTVNVMFHPAAWAFASRPLMNAFNAGNIFQGPTDPVSGIALRLELSRQYKQETLSYDILYGAGWVRRELACKILG